jgi:hypothetical protein
MVPRCATSNHTSLVARLPARNRQRKSMVRVTRDRPSGGLLGLRTSGTLGVSNLDTNPSWVSQNYSK